MSKFQDIIKTWNQMNPIKTFGSILKPIFPHPTVRSKKQANWQWRMWEYTRSTYLKTLFHIWPYFHIPTRLKYVRSQPMHLPHPDTKFFSNDINNCPTCPRSQCSHRFRIQYHPSDSNKHAEYVTTDGSDESRPSRRRIQNNNYNTHITPNLRSATEPR